MGFRTVVVLNNDQSHEWQNDPLLGQKIFANAMSDAEQLRYGNIIEMVHADVQTVVFMEHYNGKPMSHTSWYPGQTDAKKNLEMLTALADKLGYRIRKKPAKK